MADTQQRTIEDLTITIDRLVCVGFEDCVVLAPDVFRLDGEGIACFVDGGAAPDRERVIEACRACPVDALLVIDADGAQLAP